MNLRLSAVLAGIMINQSAWSMSHVSYGIHSQQAITLHSKRESVRSVLSRILNGSGQAYMLDSSVNGTTTLNLNNVPMKDALEALLKVHRLTAIDHGGMLVIQAIEPVATPDYSQDMPEYDHKYIVPRTPRVAMMDPLTPKPSASKNVSDSPAKQPEKPVKNAQLNEPVYDEKGFPLVRILGITGSPGQYNAIVSVNGAQKLLKEGNTVAGYTEVARIEKDRMLLKNPTGDTKTVAF